MKYYFLILLMLISFSGNVSARTIGSSEFTCPIDGKKFEANVEMSGTKLGMALDLKPLGPIGAPPLMPQCPDNKFVLYKEYSEFTQEEIDTLKPYIHSKNYQELAKDNSTYYLAAKIMLQMHDDNISIAETLLKATWQVDDNPDKYSVYAKETIEAFQKYIKSSAQKNNEWLVANIIVGELLRRTNKFNEAKNQFLLITPMSELNENEIYKSIVEYQLMLIENKDSKPHELPEK